MPRDHQRLHHGCETGNPCFRPFNNVTRGQLTKILSNAAGWFDTIPSTQQTFTDVPPQTPFWVYIERAYMHGAVSGYTHLTAMHHRHTLLLAFQQRDEGADRQDRSVAAGYSETIPSTQQTFVDVPNSNPFWVYIERIALHGVIAGYQGDDINDQPMHRAWWSRRDYSTSDGATTRREDRQPRSWLTPSSQAARHLVVILQRDNIAG